LLQKKEIFGKNLALRSFATNTSLVTIRRPCLANIATLLSRKRLGCCYLATIALLKARKFPETQPSNRLWTRHPLP